MYFHLKNLQDTYSFYHNHYNLYHHILILNQENILIKLLYEQENQFQVQH